MFFHHDNEHLQKELNNIIFTCQMHDKNIDIITNKTIIKYTTTKNKRRIKSGILWVYSPNPARGKYYNDMVFQNNRINRLGLFRRTVIGNQLEFENTNICSYCFSENNVVNIYLCHLDGKIFGRPNQLDVFCPHSYFIIDELNYFFNNY